MNKCSKSQPLFLVIIVIISLFANGYLYYSQHQLSENELKLSQEISKLKTVKVQKEINDFDSLDTIAKRFISAMSNKDINIMKNYTAKNIRFTNKELIITLSQSNDKIIYPYPSEKINAFTQSYHYSDDKERFITGYKCTDNKGNWVIQLTFIREGNEWKIQNIGNDN